MADYTMSIYIISLVCGRIVPPGVYSGRRKQWLVSQRDTFLGLALKAFDV